MIYALRLFEVDVAKCADFTSAFDYGGLWQEIAGTLPGHLFTHLLRHEGNRNIYLAIEFWESETHFMRSRKSVQVIALSRWIQSSARAYFNLGTFRFRNPDRASITSLNSCSEKHE